MKKSNFFWVGYSDLLTSLFFIMLVLYAITLVILGEKQSRLEVAKRQVEEIKRIEQALQQLDTNYFQFEHNKRYRLKTDVQFNDNSADIIDIPLEKREEIFKAGQELFRSIKKITQENKNIEYLLIIEGNSARSEINKNYVIMPDEGYKLSYRRSLALFNYWKRRGLDFRSIGSQCEVIIAGSGYFGSSRDEKKERNNKKFTIQITSKVGKLINLEE